MDLIGMMGGDVLICHLADPQFVVIILSCGGGDVTPVNQIRGVANMEAHNPIPLCTQVCDTSTSSH